MESLHGIKAASIGVGGPLRCLLVGLTGYHRLFPWWGVSPLFCFILVPLTVLCPPLLPLWLLKLIKDYKGCGHYSCAKLYLERLDIGHRLSSVLGLIIASVICYYLVGALSVFWANHEINEALIRYINFARESKVLQIGSPAQIEYANSVILTIMICVMVIASTMILSFAITGVAILCPHFHKINRAIFKNVAIVLIGNMPGIALLFAMWYCVAMVIERYYAHLRILALEALVLEQEYFDPSLAFMALRFYIIGAFIVAFALIILMSLRLLPLPFNDDDDCGYDTCADDCSDSLGDLGSSEHGINSTTAALNTYDLTDPVTERDLDQSQRTLQPMLNLNEFMMSSYADGNTIFDSDAKPQSSSTSQLSADSPLRSRVDQTMAPLSKSISPQWSDDFAALLDGAPPQKAPASANLSAAASTPATISEAPNDPAAAAVVFAMTVGAGSKTLPVSVHEDSSVSSMPQDGLLRYGKKPLMGKKCGTVFLANGEEPASCKRCRRKNTAIFCREWNMFQAHRLAEINKRDA